MVKLPPAPDFEFIFCTKCGRELDQVRCPCGAVGMYLQTPVPYLDEGIVFPSNYILFTSFGEPLYQTESLDVVFAYTDDISG